MRYLVGKGFVGSSLTRKTPFHRVFDSESILTLRAGPLDTVIVAALLGVKWQVNADPDADLASTYKLLSGLCQVDREATVVLLGTIDVYADPIGVDETADPGWPQNRYGFHRRLLEEWALSRFPNVVVLRLPGLFGPGLRRNAIYSLMTGEDLEYIHPLSAWPWYDLDGLWSDVERAIETRHRVINIAPEPIPTVEIARRFFPEARWESRPDAPLVTYDVRSIYSEHFGGHGDYWYDKEEGMWRIGRFLSKLRR